MKDYLFRKNLSVKQLAADLEISPSYLYQLVRGERKPSLELAKKIETITDGEVTVGRLLGFKGEKPGMDLEAKYDARLAVLERVQGQFDEKIAQIESRLSKLEKQT